VPSIRRQSGAVRDRDASLLRVGSVTRTIAVATVAAVGALTFYVSKALPGHHSVAATSASTGPVVTGSPATTPAGVGSTTISGASASSTSQQTSAPAPTITPPTSPPVRTPSPASVTSGAT
jgi:hypothetical protein